MPPPTSDDAVSSHLAGALAHHRAGRLREAAALYRQLLEAEPDHAEATHLLGVVCFQEGDNNGGEALIRRAIERAPGSHEAHHDLGDVLRAQGRVDDAIASYRRALDLAPDFRDSLVNLAQLLQQQGHLADAVIAYERALALPPAAPDLHYNAANALRDLGSYDEAIAHYRRALALNPKHSPALYNLGATLQMKGDVAAAMDAYRRVTAVEPKFAAAHFNLAAMDESAGRIDEAIAGYRATIAAWPEAADAHNNLGSLLAARGRLDEARASFERAIALNPGFAEAHGNLGNLALAQGRVDEAIARLARALALKETPALKANLARALAGHTFTRADADLEPYLVRALTEPWARPADLARAAASLLRADPVLGPAIERSAVAAGGAGDARALDADVARVAARHPLFASLAVAAPIPDPAVERWLTRARAALWDAGPDAAVDDALTFAALLARQCIVNEHAYVESGEETQRADAARDALAAALASDAPVAALDVARVACYRPLAALPGAERLLARDWPAPVAALLRDAVAAPLEEARLAASVAALTPIEDATSARVRAQYEANPYPRWTAAAPVEAARSFDAFLRAQLPGAPYRALGDDGGVDVLIAGCGTGQHAIETARRLPRARIVALDLARASLGYAMRAARGAGVTNVSFAQGDLLALASTGRAFDVIEAVGVLHHLADPAAGWRALVDALRPGGVLRVGLYSEQARAAVVAGRAWIAAQGLAATPGDIRRLRAHVLAAAPGDALAPLAQLRDFYATSECRDLLFHVQEQRTTIPRIRAQAAALGLTLLGFDVAPGVAAAYSARHPRDRARTDFDRWAEFDAEMPGAFAGMYELWLQKGG